MAATSNVDDIFIQTPVRNTRCILLVPRLDQLTLRAITRSAPFDSFFTQPMTKYTLEGVLYKTNNIHVLEYLREL